MKYKIGQTLYSVYADEETGKVEIETWVVRSKRKDTYYAIRKYSGTWGKKSTKPGDFGWLDPISIWDRDRTSSLWGGKFRRIFTTKRAAYADDLKSHLTYMSAEEMPDGIFDKITKTLKSQIARNSNKKGKP